MAVAQQYHQNLVHFLRKEVNYNDPGIASGYVIGRLPAGAQITQALARVKTTFDAGTTNVLTIGTNASSYDNILGAADIAEGSTGNNAAPTANLRRRRARPTSTSNTPRPAPPRARARPSFTSPTPSTMADG